MTADPRQTLANAYAESDATHGERRNARKAGAYKPEHDAEADRLKTTVGDALPTSVRLALGYHASARDAAEQIENTNPNGDNAA